MSKPTAGIDRMGLLAIVAVAFLLTIPVGTGFAVGYTATTTSASNAISADYFTAGFYDSSGNAVSTTLKDSLTYKEETSNNVTTYSIEDDTVVSVDNLYFRINKGAHANNRTYSVSATCTCIFKKTSLDAGTEAEDAVMGITLKSGNTVVSTPTSDTLYSVIMKVSDVSAEMDDDPTLISISYSILVVDNCNATYSGSDAGITITGSATSQTEHEEQVAESLDDSNPGTTVNFAASSDTDNQRSSHMNYEGGYGVTLAQGSNTSNSIGDSSGNVDVTISSTSIQSFVLIVKFGVNNNTKLTITMDNNYRTEISGDSNVHCVYMGASNLDSGIITANNGVYDVAGFMNGKTWLTGNSLSFDNNGRRGTIIVDLVSSQ